MRALWAGLKLLVLALVVGLGLAGAVLAAVGLVVVWVARAGGLEPPGVLAAVDAVVAEGASRVPLAVAVLGGSAFGLVWSRATGRSR